jgi:hypothetical protein
VDAGPSAEGGGLSAEILPAEEPPAAAPPGSSTIATEGMADTLTTCLVKPGAGESPKLAIEARAESGPASDRTPNRSGSVPLRRRVLSGGVTSLAPFDFATAPFVGVVAPFDFASALPAFAPIAHAGRRFRASASARSASKPGGALADLGAVPFEESALPISEEFSLGLDIEMVEESTTAHVDRQRELTGPDPSG